MAIQSPLSEPSDAMRVEIVTQAGIALASLEKATNHFLKIYASTARLPGADDLQKQIAALRGAQNTLRELLERTAALFEPMDAGDASAHSGD